jgi:prefoldin subunit 5
MEKDIDHCLSKRDTAQTKIIQWASLLSNIQVMKQKPINTQNKLMVNMGEEFFLQGKTNDNKEMFINAGLGFLVPMAIHSKEIDDFVKKQIQHWTKTRDYWQSRAEQAKNYIILYQSIIPPVDED